MHLRAARFELVRELREILVEVVNRVPLDLRRSLTRILPALKFRLLGVSRGFIFFQPGLNQCAMAQIARDPCSVILKLAREGVSYADQHLREVDGFNLLALPWRSSSP